MKFIKENFVFSIQLKKSIFKYKIYFIINFKILKNSQLINYLSGQDYQIIAVIFLIKDINPFKNSAKKQPIRDFCELKISNGIKK